jgi:Bacterial PH domain
VSAPTAAHEHEFEAAHGLPELLPAGERIIWQGSPDWRAVAKKVMYVRLLSFYFAAMLLWGGLNAFNNSSTVLAAAQSLIIPALLALAALGVLTTFAWLTSRTTVYTFTNRRVVMRIGIVLSVTFNLPYRMIDSASLHANADGTGDIALLLAASDKIAYGNLWPHARPWRLKRPEPMLRAVPDVLHIGQLLAAAIVAAAPAGQEAQVSRPAQPISPVNPGGHSPSSAPTRGSGRSEPLAA